MQFLYGYGFTVLAAIKQKNEGSEIVEIALRIRQSFNLSKQFLIILSLQWLPKVTLVVKQAFGNVIPHAIRAPTTKLRYSKARAPSLPRAK